jgi:hypothetical protein
MAIGTGVYGSNASNALGAIGGTVSAGGLISASAMTALGNAAINERIRRGQTNVVSVPPGYYSGVISVSSIGVLKDLVGIPGPAATQAQNGANQNINSSNGQVQIGTTPIYDNYGNYAGTTPVYGPVPQPETITYPQVAAVGNATPFASLAGLKIRAPHINSIIDQINSSRAVCTCNCNYCTCNCNYCTCNCNYSCTCNCNYSDEQVKTEIEYM